MAERVEVPVEDGIANNGVQETPDNTNTVQEVLGRPDWLPENFKSVEDFVKSHQDLRADYTRKSQELAELKKGEEPPKEGEEKPEGLSDLEKNDQKLADGETVLPGVENDFAKEVSDYAWENGSLTDEHYAKLEAAGYSKDMVDRFMEGQFAATNNANAALVNAGGGEETVQSMFDWAEKNISQTEIDNYNSQFQEGGQKAIMAMEHLKNRYDNSGDAPGGQRVQGAPTGGAQGDSSNYTSVAQVQADMSDPRYQNDPSFRRSVEEKLARSNVLGPRSV